MTVSYAPQSSISHPLAPLRHQRHLRRAREIALQLRLAGEVLLRPFDAGVALLRGRVQGPVQVGM